MKHTYMSESSSHTIYLGLGSNLGDREKNLAEVTTRLTARGITVIRESSIYETEPVGFADQPWFLNQVVEGTSIAEPEEILEIVKDIEDEMGRMPSERNGPRLIDIDILFFGELILDLPDLKIPHPRAHLRRFVLEPLCEIAPTLWHPLVGKHCPDLLDELPEEPEVRLFRRKQ